jgi:hypothetical protein
MSDAVALHFEPDWIGFDLDHTLARYKLPELRELNHYGTKFFLTNEKHYPEAKLHDPVSDFEFFYVTNTDKHRFFFCCCVVSAGRAFGTTRSDYRSTFGTHHLYRRNEAGLRGVARQQRVVDERHQDAVRRAVGRL